MPERAGYQCFRPLVPDFSARGLSSHSGGSTRMSKTTRRRSVFGRLRTRAAVLAVGLGVSTALGTGVALAADAAEQDDFFASGTASQLAEAAGRQAAEQHKAAHSAEVKKAAEKKAQQRADEDRRSSRDSDRRAAPSWRKPVSGDYELSAGFGNSGGRWAHKHSGQDFAVPTGTRVQAAHGGTVVKAGPNGAGDGPAYGNAVVIKHDDHTYSQYAHLSKVRVAVGQHVNTGQEIARSGTTGNSSGPHLHFEIRSTPDYGTAREPVAVLARYGVHV